MVHLIDSMADELQGSISELDSGLQFRMNPKWSMGVIWLNKPVWVEFARYPALGTLLDPFVFERYIGSPCHGGIVLVW